MCVCPAGLNGRDCLKWKEESGVGISRPVLVCVSDGMSPLKRGTCLIQRTSQVALVVKSPSASAGDAVDSGSIRGLGRSLEKKATTHSSILAWRIPWTEEPGELQSIGSQSQT